MPLFETHHAIGSVTLLLRDTLKSLVSVTDISIGRPEPPSSNTLAKPRLNLFLYESFFDPTLKNFSLHHDQQPPAWLGLRYLLTAFDGDGESDTIEAHNILGEAIRVLNGINFLSLTSETESALIDNPEPLKITFSDSSFEFLSKIMQGSDEKYRLSICFEVRPIMITTSELPSASKLVGVDYTLDPTVEIGEDGISLDVIPISSPIIDSVEPQKFEPFNIMDDSTTVLKVIGSNLTLNNLKVFLETVELPILFKTNDSLECFINSEIKYGNLISAGVHKIIAQQELPSGRIRTSNPLFVNLLPIFESITVSLNGINADPTSDLHGDVVIKGTLLGTQNDDVLIILLQNDKVVRIFDDFSIPEPLTQSEITLSIPNTNPIPRGSYSMVLRVNGQQAIRRPLVRFDSP